MYLPDVTLRLVVRWVATGFLCQMLLGYFFYKSVWSVLFLLPVTFLVAWVQWRHWQQQVRRDIEAAFQDWLSYVKGGLSGGRSFEQSVLKSKEAFLAAIGTKHAIRPGIEQLYKGMELHIATEVCLEKLGKETGVDVIEDFAAVFAIAKKQGGRMSLTLEKTMQHIYGRIELRSELYAMIAAKKLEQRIMCVMPFGILFFVGNASGGYFTSLYHNVQGVCIMTGCMGVYLIGVWWGERLTEVAI